MRAIFSKYDYTWFLALDGHLYNRLIGIFRVSGEATHRFLRVIEEDGLLKLEPVF